MDIKVTHLPATYELIDGEFVCSHELTELVRACCSAFKSNVDCGCGGVDETICLNAYCTGLEVL